MATDIATALLSDRMPQFETGEYVVTKVVEFDTAWVFFWNSRRLAETGDFHHRLGGNGPVVVPKSGAEPWWAWSGADIASQIAQGKAPF